MPYYIRLWSTLLLGDGGDQSHSEGGIRRAGCRAAPRRSSRGRLRWVLTVSLFNPRFCGDLAHRDVDDETVAVVEAGVQADLLEDHPRHRADRLLHLSRAGEDLDVGLRSNLYSPVGRSVACVV